MKYKVRTEAFDLMQYFYSSAHDPLIRARIRFEGRIDPELLKRAVNLSVLAVPVVQCSFSSQTHGWEHRGYQADQIVKVVESAEPGREERLLLDAIDLNSESPLKIHLVRGEASDALCVILSHLVADGAGFKQYLYLLSSLYRRCRKAPGYIVPPEPMDRDVGQVFQGMSLAERIRVLRAPMENKKQKESMYLPLKEDQGEPVTVLSRLDGELFSSVKQFAKKAGVTVNDLLLVAYGRAHHTLTGCQSLTLPCPVDLRNYLPEGAKCGICNLTSNYMCEFSVKEGDTFQETLGKVHGQMSAQKGSRDCLKGPMILDLLFRALPYSAAKKTFDKSFSIPVVSFTNLGVLDWRKLDFGNGKITDAYLVTAVKRPPSFQVSVSTYGGCCTLSSSLYAAEKNREIAESFLREMVSELERAVREFPHKVPAKSQNNAGGDSRAEGQPARQQKKQNPKSKRANADYKRESKSKPKQKKTVRKK